jgi:hypothetical protein
MAIYDAQTNPDAYITVENINPMVLTVVGMPFDAWTSIFPFRQALTHVLI